MARDLSVCLSMLRGLIMKIHLTLYPNTTTGKVVSECGIARQPDNFVYPKDKFLAHTEPTDICKQCVKIYHRLPRYLK